MLLGLFVHPSCHRLHLGDHLGGADQQQTRDPPLPLQPMPARKVRHSALCFLPFALFFSFSFVQEDRFSFLFPPPGPRRTSPPPPPASSPVLLRRGPPPAATIRNCASPWRRQPESRKGRSFSSHTRRDISSNSSSCC